MRVHQEPALYRALGVTELDDTALLDRFVLPRFASLAPPQQARVYACLCTRMYVWCVWGGAWAWACVY